MYISLDGFVSTTTQNLTTNTTYLPLPQEDYDFLLQALGDGGYSFLALCEGRAIEIVKVENFCGKLVIHRGEELTKPLAFHRGIRVEFALTMQGVKDTVCQMEIEDNV